MLPEAQAVLDAADAATRGTFDDRLREAINALFSLPEEDRRVRTAAIAEAIPTLGSTTGAGLLAVWFGGSVENGLDPTPTTPVLMQTLLDRCSRVQTNEEGQPTAGYTEDWATGTQLLGQGLVAHLVRVPERRAAYASDPEVVDVLESVEHLSAGVVWVLEVLRRKSGELVVVHATERAGVRVRYEEIANCFQLFTLMQAEFAGKMPGSGTADPEVVALATGQGDGKAHDSAWWHYGQPFSNEPNVVASVFGEAPVESIGEVDGERVMLLWPPVLEGRSWDSGFFGPPIAGSTPSVRVTEELTPVDLERWWQRLHLPVADGDSA